MLKNLRNYQELKFLSNRLDRKFFTQPTLKVAKKLLGKYIVRKIDEEVLASACPPKPTARKVASPHFPAGTSLSQKLLQYNLGDKFIIGKIVETEAYIGPLDKASHAYSKKEQSTKEKLKILKQNLERIKNYLDNEEKFIERILKLKNGKVTKRNLAEYLRGGHIYIYLVYGNYYQLNITSFKEGYPECVLIRALEPITPHKPDPNGPGKLCEFLKLDSSFWGEDLVRSKRIWLVNGEDIKEKDIVKRPRIGIDYAEEHKHLLWRFYIKGNKFVSRK